MRLIPSRRSGQNETGAFIVLGGVLTFSLLIAFAALLKMAWLIVELAIIQDYARFSAEGGLATYLSTSGAHVTRLAAATGAVNDILTNNYQGSVLGAFASSSPSVPTPTLETGIWDFSMACSPCFTASSDETQVNALRVQLTGEASSATLFGVGILPDPGVKTSNIDVIAAHHGSVGIAIVSG